MELGIIEPIFDTISDEIVVIDRDFKITLVNSEFCKRYNISRRDVIDSDCYRILHHSEEPCVFPNNICPLRYVIKSKKAYSCSHKCFIDGNTYLCEPFTYPFEIRDGEVLSVCKINKRTGAISRRRESKGELKKGFHSKNIPLLDRKVLIIQKVKELIQDIQIITDLCLFLLKKPLNKEEIRVLLMDIYTKTQYGLGCLTDLNSSQRYE